MVKNFLLNSYFFCMWHLWYFCGKITSVCWLLYKIGKWLLMIVLRIGNKVLYCAMKLNDVEKVVFCNLSFLVSSLVSFLMSENCIFTLTGLPSLAIKHFWYSALRFSIFFIRIASLPKTQSNTLTDPLNVIFTKTRTRESIYETVCIFSKHSYRNLFRVLSNLSLRSKNSNVSIACIHSKLKFFSRVNFVRVIKNISSSSILCDQAIKISSLNLFRQIDTEAYSEGITSKY